jgi:rod shape-determining protein MreB
MLQRFLSSFSTHVGVDLGTANSLVYVKGRGIVLIEPSIVAMNTKTGQILSVGDEAKKIVGRTPMHIAAIRPLVDGVIADFDITQEMLRYFFRRVQSSKNGSLIFYPRVVIGVPSGLTEVEKKAVEDAALDAGAAEVYLVAEPIAAALGARLPLEDPTAHLIVDIGGGTTEIAVLSMGGIVVARSLKIAGDKFSEEIIKFIRDEFQLLVGEPTAEAIKIAVGSARQIPEALQVQVKGRDLSTGLPREITITDAHVRSAMRYPLATIIDTIKEVVETTPPELVGDVMHNGVFLCGGGSLLRGIDDLIQKEVHVRTNIINDPMTAVVRGTGVIIEEFDRYKGMLSVSERKELSL